MQGNLFTASIFIVMLLAGTCYPHNNTFYYSDLTHTELNYFNSAINGKDDPEGAICRVPIGAKTTKVLVEIAKSGREIESFDEDSIMFVIADGREKMLILNGWFQVQLSKDSIFEISEASLNRIVEELQKSIPDIPCNQSK